MKHLALLATTALVALGASLPAHAQDRILGIERLDDTIDDITRDATDELARGEDDERFSPLGVSQGVRGSAALTASGSSGNSENAELSFAGRLTYGVGEWTHLFGFAGEFNDASGNNREEEVFGIYEGSRAFTPQVYAFGTGRYEYDGVGTNQDDAFLGGGLGYRILNTSDVAWRVQGGPGVRYIDLRDGGDETEFAGIASSRFFYGFTDVVSLTNDTDILGSDENTVVTNDLGVNFRMSDNFSTRVSYRTDYNSDPVGDLESTDNTLGLSLVVGF